MIFGGGACGMGVGFGRVPKLEAHLIGLVVYKKMRQWSPPCAMLCGNSEKKLPVSREKGHCQKLNGLGFQS